KGAYHFVRDGRILQRNSYHMLLCDFASLADRVSHFTSLAQTQTDSALLVTNYNQGAETEPPAAFDNLGRAVDKNHFLRQFVGRFAFKKGGVALSLARSPPPPGSTGTPTGRAASTRTSSDLVSHSS